ncbi:hypothetical protein [Streptomyces sp. 6N223]|uniref:hypothetical protein n=1 Tax=Streptomyces sp. 6N223 TaxID=3457412 RepID=UPI003FD55473
MTSGQHLGLLHEAHPLLGRLVLDTSSGRIGVLRAVVRDDASRRAARRRAWLRPEGGGVEWATDPEAITELDR